MGWCCVLFMIFSLKNPEYWFCESLCYELETPPGDFKEDKCGFMKVGVEQVSPLFVI